MKFYGIRNIKTKIPLAFHTRPNDNGSDCVSVRFSLIETGGDIVHMWYDYAPWLLCDKDRVNYVFNNHNTGWYNADVMSPSWSGKTKEYEVFEVEI